MAVLTYVWLETDIYHYTEHNLNFYFTTIDFFDKSSIMNPNNWMRFLTLFQKGYDKHEMIG